MSSRPLAVDVIEAGFAPDHEGARWIFTGSLTFANAGPVLAATTALSLPTDGEVDLDNLDGIDSSAVAVLVALARRAESEGRPLRFVHVPAAAAALAQTYGVEWVLGT